MYKSTFFILLRVTKLPGCVMAAGIFFLILYYSECLPAKPPATDEFAASVFGREFSAWSEEEFAFIPDSPHHGGPPVRLAYFQSDMTPPLGSPLAFGIARKIVDSLTARGVILQFDEYPVVLCAVDWIGISEEGMDRFKEQLAAAAGTKKERVSVHALHLHDAVRCDFSTPRILDLYDDPGKYYDTNFLGEAIGHLAGAVQEAATHMEEVTRISFGQSEVEKVASNRRLIGQNGKVSEMRWSNTTDARARRAPEGKIDPLLKMVTFWTGEKPMVSLSFYAVHPVTYFGEGEVSTDFVGIARSVQEQKRGHPQIYFTGAAGDVGVGKYNDGSFAMRRLLAFRLSRAMDEAWASRTYFQVEKDKFKWKHRDVFLPLADFMHRDSLEMIVSGLKQDPELPYLRAVSSLAWLNRVYRYPEVQVSALHIEDLTLLLLPGEPFVEYQLAAEEMAPEKHICTAAYTEYGMGYIGTARSYQQGGYETSKMSSKVSPAAEKALLKAIEAVLK